MLLTKLLLFGGFFNTFGYFTSYNGTDKINMRDINNKIKVAYVDELRMPHMSILRSREIQKKIRYENYINNINGLYIKKFKYDKSFIENWDSYINDVKLFFNLENFNNNVCKFTLFANNKQYYVKSK